MISPKVSEMRWVRYLSPIQPLQSLYPAKHILQLELSCAAPMTSQRDDLMQNSPNPSFQIYSFFHKLKVKSLLTSPASNHCNYKQFHLSTKGCTYVQWSKILKTVHFWEVVLVSSKKAKKTVISWHFSMEWPRKGFFFLNVDFSHSTLPK